MDSYVSFEAGVVENSQELVGNDVVIDLNEMKLSLSPSDGGDRQSIPLNKMTRVELEEQPEVRDHGT